ncbi:MAG TPA: cation-transporting P-type ATPase [Hyphomicrobium sp.]|jgi:Ca2+-transporting ATPase
MAASAARVEHGLSGSEAAARLARHGPNALPEPPPVALWQRLLRQFASPLIYILLFALALDLALWGYEGMQGTPFEALAIAIVLVFNAALGAYQEGKAEAALDHLKSLAAPSVWVVRDDTLMQVRSRDLVPGDLARVEAGDRVPADGTLARGTGVLADESVLTGESLPVDKEVGAELFSGTLLVRGKGYMRVSRTGRESAMGRLAVMIGGIEAGMTPLERRLRAFGAQIAVAVLALGLVLTLGGLVVEGPGRIAHVLVFSVALAVAAVPEDLPAAMTLALALGVERLAGRKAIVRRLSAVEALGSVTVIATDKTGTLTENRMYVRDVEFVDAPRALKAIVLANDAEFGARAGDPLELALFDYAAERGVDPDALTQSHPRVGSLPFDSAKGFMSVTVDEEGRRVSYLKGAPEVLIARSCLSQAEKQVWEAKALQHAKEGYRVLGVGWGAEVGEDGIVFLGLVLLWDPPRIEVPHAIARAQGAGIRVLMITGDHPATAETVGRSIGISSARVLTGAELDRMSGEEVREAAASVDVFARVAPEHKLKLVEALKANGEIVAVTGDGVNDAPALKRADVGVAMGRRGSDVAREVADLVLLDDNFATIVAAIEEGRSIYENIQKCIRLLFSTNFALVLLVVIGLGLAFALNIRDPSGGMFLLPLTAAQLLWINIISEGPPALAFTLDRNAGLMRRPPRPATAQLLDATSLRFIAVTGTAKALAGVAFLVLLPLLGYAIEATRTSLFLYEAMVQLVFAYPAQRINVHPLRNPILHFAVWGGIALQALTVLIPGLRALLGLVPIDAAAFLLVAVGVIGGWGVAAFVGWWLGTHNAARVR